VGLAIGLLILAFAALAQVSILPSFSIFGVHPNLVVVLLAAWMSIRGRSEALVLIPFGGLVLGLLDSQPLGLAMLALTPLMLLTEIREMRLVESDLLPAVILVAVATLSYEIAILLTLVAEGGHAGFQSSVLDVLVPAVIANVLLLLPVYGIVSLASWDTRLGRAV
jgi:rod shape-determining protein MreD